MPEYRDRLHTKSIKWDFQEQITGKKDLISLWVADMDFKTAPAIIERLEERLEHGVFGYSGIDAEYKDVLEEWYHDRYQVGINQESISTFPGVVPAMAAALRCFLKPGDRVIYQPPVYYPFEKIISSAGCRPSENQLLYKHGNTSEPRWEIDFEDLEKQFRGDAGALLLCSPHNPVGRVWTEEELERIIKLCDSYGVLLISDEIHGDLIMKGHIQHSALKWGIEENLMVFSAASKSFNIPGLNLAHGIIPNLKRKKILDEYFQGLGLGIDSIMGIEASIAAYSSSRQWLAELIETVWQNYLFLKDALHKNFPDFTISPLEGTYLAWVHLGERREKDVRRKLLVDHGVWPHFGSTFGSGGEGFIRINLATDKSILNEAVVRMVRLLSR
jgi:cystathionine beta-lyase